MQLEDGYMAGSAARESLSDAAKNLRLLLPQRGPVARLMMVHGCYSLRRRWLMVMNKCYWWQVTPMSWRISEQLCMVTNVYTKKCIVSWTTSNKPPRRGWMASLMPHMPHPPCGLRSSWLKPQAATCGICGCVPWCGAP